MKLPTTQSLLQNIKSSFTALVNRFPITVVLVFITAIFFFTNVHLDGNDLDYTQFVKLEIS